MDIVKLRPATKDNPWGGSKLIAAGKETSSSILAECWELSFHPDGLCLVDSGPDRGKYLRDVATDADKGKLCKKFPEFPILIKLIDAEANLSVQVHPNDDYAKKVEHDLGKTEMWHIISAEPGAGLYVGFRRDTTKDEILFALANNSIMDLLNFVEVKEGDTFFIPAGTVHAIGKGVTLIEIQESSNITYRLYDYGRMVNGKPRALNVDKALEVLSTSAYEQKKAQGTVLGKCKYFVCWKEDENSPVVKASKDSFLCISFLKGQGTVNGIPFKALDTFFVPAGSEARITGHSYQYVLTGIPR
ncbi:MAG: class I mannose-6-phosphate isomerase [Bacilli bacterium]|nr:class I mannose-6-phosphate isomerase [Bacilli bacterium]